MRNDALEFFKTFDYTQEDTAALMAVLDRILADPAAAERFAAMRQSYIQAVSFDAVQAYQEAQAIGDLVGAHVYQVFFLYLVMLAKPLKEFYRQRGISEEIWYNSMLDLKWKNEECKLVKGMCGTFTNWFARFFDLTRFAIGRLQFEIITTDAEYTVGTLTLPAGSPVINVHIPRTGTKLDRDSVQNSYRQAAAFYAPQLPAGMPVIFTCHSWLLFPRHREVLKPDSNILAFMNDFMPIDDGLYANYSSVWRLFDKDYEGDVNALPQDSSLRRAYAAWITKGEPVGWGRGAFIYRET